ncbi:hypothetical protein K503DRAFT_773037, partial [Rhizopogon vinicolor AM-OR11-026]
MPPAKIKTSKHRKTTPNDSRASSSTRNAKSKPDYTVKPEPQEVSIPKVSAPYLTPEVLQELWEIWKSDPRVPTAASRRAWAVSRNANPRRIHHWFYIRKKTGNPISDETYELSLESRAVPVVLEARKELASPSPSPSLVCSDMTDVDPPSDDTLVADYSLHEDVFYMPPRSYAMPSPSASPAISTSHEPTKGHAYMRYYSQESSVSRPVTPEAIQVDEQKADCNKCVNRLHSFGPSLQQR